MLGNSTNSQHATLSCFLGTCLHPVILGGQTDISGRLTTLCHALCILVTQQIWSYFQNQLWWQGSICFRELQKSQNSALPWYTQSMQAYVSCLRYCSSDKRQPTVFNISFFFFVLLKKEIIDIRMRGFVFIYNPVFENGFIHWFWYIIRFYPINK